MLIAITRKDGGVSIMSVVSDQEGAISNWRKNHVNSYVSSKEITADALPISREFRDAWFLNGKSVDTDMPKARKIHMDKIRGKRNEKLKELDIETLKGKDVQAQKQTLRDLPQNFDLTGATTPEELKRLWPDDL